MLVCILLSPFSASAAQGDGMSITITPPLFQLALQPGESWSSNVTVVNNNAYSLSLYANPVLFRPSGETGKPAFLVNTIGDGPMATVDESTLAGWITVPEGAFAIQREQTYSLPITIHVPNDATPGGHYAAILIGNNAPESVTQEGTVNVTSSVAVLIFLTVSGDVVEEGRVREFSTEKTLYETAEAHFTLRFENQGNVHLLPQGNIVIYNMFGKERGTIPINLDGNYGNVLPESIRNYSFSWKSDSGLWDIGRYKAIATIGYGKNGKQSTYSVAYFYILPIIPLLEVIGGALFLIFLFTWSLKHYIRRALSLETKQMGIQPQEQLREVREKTKQQVQNSKVRIGALVEPIREGFVDLRSASVGRHDGSSVVGSGAHVDASSSHDVYSASSFIKKYRLFFIFIILLCIGWYALTIYLRDVMTEERAYDASEVLPDGSHVPIYFD